MERDVQVAAILVTAAAVVLAAGIYLVASEPHPLPTGPSASVWEARLVPGLSYLRPVLGPTTPYSSVDGALWVVNAAREGVIQMNLTRAPSIYWTSPFTAGNDSVILDIAADFQETGSPLEAVYYLAPARDWPLNGTTGPAIRNGAIAFFAGRDFVVADPFNRSAWFAYRLPFTPTWTGQDPASAGDLLVVQTQHVLTVGLADFPVGPYQYFYASDGNHTVVFETDYVHGGYCPCDPPSGRLAFSLNATLTARPLVFYDSLAVSSGDAFRSGLGQAFLFPLANQTLEVVNVTGVPRGWIPLRLGGQQASVIGDIGVSQAFTPQGLYVPVRSASSTGFLEIDLATLSVTWDYIAGDATLVPVGPPLSRLGTTIFTAWYGPRDNRTHFAAVNESGSPIPESLAVVPGRVVSVFFVSELAKLFIESQAGQVLTLSTDYAAAGNLTPTQFPVTLPSTGTIVYYAGSAGGTRYGPLLAPVELFGAWTNTARATTALFSLTPPPKAVT